MQGDAGYRFPRIRSVVCCRAPGNGYRYSSCSDRKRWLGFLQTAPLQIAGDCLLRCQSGVQVFPYCSIFREQVCAKTLIRGSGLVKREWHHIDTGDG